MEHTTGGKAYGPYKDKRNGVVTWRVVLVGPGSGRAARSYPTEAAAQEVVNATRRKTQERTVGLALSSYIDYLRIRGNRVRTVKTTTQRLDRLVKSVQTKPVTVLTGTTARELYESLSKQVAVDTHRNTLSQARTWGRWMVKTGWLKTNPWADVEAFGERNYGKPQLRIDEARKLWAYLRPRLDGKSELATAIVLTLGLRASEVVAITARDIDAGASVLWIERGKTRRARRQLRIPLPLQAPLWKLSQAGGRLFPHWPKWVLDSCKRCATAAGVEGSVTAHGLRGLHATLKVDIRGIQPDLGHAPGSDVTEKHYLQPGTVERATAQHVWEVLDG